MRDIERWAGLITIVAIVVLVTAASVGLMILG